LFDWIQDKMENRLIPNLSADRLCSVREKSVRSSAFSSCYAIGSLDVSAQINC
jgi:hypothetical protein